MVAVINAKTCAVDCLSFNEWRFGILSYHVLNLGEGLLEQCIGWGSVVRKVYNACDIALSPSNSALFSGN